jgi:hypothetical protein
VPRPVATTSTQPPAPTALPPARPNRPDASASASVDAAASEPPPLAPGIQRIERRWVDLGPPPSLCPPPRACSNGSLVVDRACVVSGDDDDRPFRAQADPKVCAVLFALAEREIAPRMRANDPCTREGHHGGAKLKLVTNMGQGLLEESQVHVDFCQSTEPWKGFLAKLMALHP